MFVSGPVGTSVPVPGAILLRDELDRVLRDGSDVARRQARAVEAALAVDVRGDVRLADERPVGAARDRDVGAADELEHAERVRRSSCRASGCRARS